jgi:hypothetical protein
MKRSSTFILGSLMALSLAGCRSSRNDGTADTRTGSADSTAMTHDTGSSSMDTAMSGGAGAMSDTGRMHKDTTSR